MTMNLLALASDYHAALPARIRAYLAGRGLSEEIVDLHRLGWNGRRVTIPIFDRAGAIAFFRLGKDPDDGSAAPEMVSSRGAKTELYGWERVTAQPTRIVVASSEYDRLVLESHGIAAVASTGGREGVIASWGAHFASIAEVYLCLGSDDAGRSAARRVAEIIPHAKEVVLPSEGGASASVTDFFVRLGHGRDEFLQLLESATPIPTPPSGLPVVPDAPAILDEFHQRVVDVKATITIAEVVARYVPLQASPGGMSLRGRCPFHDDRYPSLMVYPIAGVFRCYGCGLHGDVITFMMAVTQFPFMRALQALEHFYDDGPPAARL